MQLNRWGKVDFDYGIEFSFALTGLRGAGFIQANNEKLLENPFLQVKGMSQFLSQDNPLLQTEVSLDVDI